MRNKLILVTGANGFIGRLLCARLRAEGARVRALLRTTADGPWDEVVAMDLTQKHLPAGLMNAVDTVFHLAGKVHALDEVRSEEVLYQSINVEGTRLLLDAAGAACVDQFIFFSSVKALGEGDKETLDENCTPVPTTFYGKSKLQAENLVLSTKNIRKVSVVRPAMVYGPGSPGNLDRMIRAVQKGFFPPWPLVKNRRSMVHVEDLIYAALLVEKEPDANRQVFIVTDGRHYSTQEIYHWICAAVGVSVPHWSVPLPLLAGLAKTGDGLGWILRRNFPFNSDVLSKLAGSSAYDSSKLSQMLGFAPRWTLESALGEIIASLR